MENPAGKAYTPLEGIQGFEDSRGQVFFLYDFINVEMSDSTVLLSYIFLLFYKYPNIVRMTFARLFILYHFLSLSLESLAPGPLESLGSLQLFRDDPYDSDRLDITEGLKKQCFPNLSCRKGQFLGRARPHPPSPVKGLWRDKQGFSVGRTWVTPQPGSSQAAGANPRRTPHSAKRAIYGWTRI